jgi:uncharacterized membrane protein
MLWRSASRDAHGVAKRAGASAVSRGDSLSLEPRMWTSLIPNPLHPAIVHLPIAIVVLLPLTIIGALWAIRRGASVVPTWSAAVAMHALLAGTAWLALATGDPAKETVEQVVAEAPIESHEEAAEAFLAIAAGALVLSLIGARRDRLGAVARVSTVAGSAVLIAAGWNVGHSGGQLVYRYGAASAYTSPDSTGSSRTPSRTPSRAPSAGRAERGDDDDR